ncbi:hypothetical protein ABID56_001114 [Alkalibacillus flavidus]|uniref:Phosphodiester glycosidase domain-containing protein n=1 Tax=Alkalibacillus flavidus TaxID=546021 RepID=A0ABV2KTW6_9BACI
MTILHKQLLKRFVASLILIVSIFSIQHVSHASLIETDQLEVTPGVDYNRYDESSSEAMSSRMMSVDLSEQHVDVGLNIGDPYPNLLTTTTLADRLTYNTQQVVGGINGSFFHFDSERPSYMLAQNDKLFNLGAVSDDSSGYMSVPKAFGMMPDGSAKIDSFDMQLSYEINGKTYEIDKYNGARGSGETVLFTPSHKFDWTRTNEYGVEIHVDQVDQLIDDEPIQFGDTITGEVKKVRRYLSNEYIQQPEDGFVISIHGDTPIDDNLEVGDSVELNVDINDEWKGAEFVLGSGPQLVRNGQVDLEMDEDSSRAKRRNPRTVVGTNANGSEVFFITVDGRQPGYSDGMTMEEVAEYVESLGVEHAINLDGGGSTTMVARQYGDTHTSVMNSPSGGYERGVSNGLFAMVTDQSDKAEKISVDVAEEGKILNGASVGLDVEYVLDEYYHPLTYNESDVEYSVSNNIGRVENGEFIATNAGEGNITASYDGASTTIPVEVVDGFDQVDMTPNDIRLGVGETQSFTVTPQMNDGSHVVWDDSQIEWSTSGNIGVISNEGVLTANSISATGEVHATINHQTYTSEVRVGGGDVVIDSFETIDQWSDNTVRATGDIRLSDKFAPSVTGNALRLDYNFNNGEGTSAVYAQYDGNQSFSNRPNEIGAWVFGDGEGHWLRAQLLDASGDVHYLNFTEEHELDWDGWNYVTADIPDGIETPYTLNSIYVVEPSSDRKGEGFIYVDELQLSYNGEHDTDASFDQSVVSPTKEWRVTFDQAIDTDSVKSDSIFITNAQGDSFDVSYQIEQNKEVIAVEPEEPLDPGVYQLTIGSVTSQDGDKKLSETVKPFIVE